MRQQPRAGLLGNAARVMRHAEPPGAAASQDAHLFWPPLGIMRLPAVGGWGGLNWGFVFRFDPGGATVVVDASAAPDGTALGTGISVGCGAGRFPLVGGGDVGAEVGSLVGAGRLPDVGGVHAALAR